MSNQEDRKERQTNLLINSIKHLRKILVHKFWVLKYCKICSITWRGLIHDMSKFSPTEFLESAKYYTGTSSPIDTCKKERGYSLSWQHHKGRNKHHYEYWVDNLDNGGTCIIIPYTYTVEMLCDFLGAGRAYKGKNFNYADEWEWWMNKLSTHPKMHWKNQYFITYILYNLFINERDADSNLEYRSLNKFHLMYVYEYCVKDNNREEDYHKFLQEANKIFKGGINNG